jgi:hypothetical protein
MRGSKLRGISTDVERGQHCVPCLRADKLARSTLTPKGSPPEGARTSGSQVIEVNPPVSASRIEGCTGHISRDIVEYCNYSEGTNSRALSHMPAITETTTAARGRQNDNSTLDPSHGDHAIAFGGSDSYSRILITQQPVCNQFVHFTRSRRTGDSVVKRAIACTVYVNITRWWPPEPRSRNLCPAGEASATRQTARRDCEISGI